jgi:hypothetical protein
MQGGARLQAIKKIIELQVGKDNQISSGKIGPQVRIHESMGHVKVRRLILDVVRHMKIPIGAGGKGYFLIRTEDELDEYVAGISKRIAEMEKRKVYVQVAFGEYYNKPGFFKRLFSARARTP